MITIGGKSYTPMTFWYQFNNGGRIALAANAIAQGAEFKVNDDADFQALYFLGFATDQVGNKLALTAIDVDLILHSSQTGRDYSNGPVPIGSTVGNGLNPFPIPGAPIFTKGTSVDLSFNNNDATAYYIKLGFIGLKLIDSSPATGA